MQPVRRGGSANWYARHYLQREEAAVVGRSEIWRSLKTGDQREAKRRLAKVIAEIQAYVDDAMAKTKAEAVARLLAMNGYGDGPWTRERLDEVASLLTQHADIVFATINNKLVLGHADAMERTRSDLMEAQTPLRQRFPDAKNPLLILDRLRQQGVAPRYETLSALIDKFAATSKAREKTKGLFRLAVNRLTTFLGSDRDPREVQRDDALRFRDWLLKQPRNRRKDGTPAGDRLLSSRTVKRDCDLLRTLFTFAVDEGCAEINPFAAVRVDYEERRKEPWSRAELSAFFRSNVFHSAPAGLRWLFVLAATTGARLDELAQLGTDAVATEDKIVHLRIRGGDIKLKTASSARSVPVPSAVLQLGFMRHVRATVGSLFGDFKRDRDGKASTAASKKCIALIRATGIQNRDFHGLRHYVIDALREVGTDPFLERRITGHAVKDAHSGYGHGYSLRRLLDALNALPVDFLPAQLEAHPVAMAAE